MTPRSRREERAKALPRALPARERRSEGAGRLSGWIKPKSEETPPPIHIGAPGTMTMGLSERTQERQGNQWRRLPGEKFFKRKRRRQYRPAPPTGFVAEIISTGGDNEE